MVIINLILIQSPSSRPVELRRGPRGWRLLRQPAAVGSAVKIINARRRSFNPANVS